MTTYTQPRGTSEHTYFQDVELSPVTLANGELYKRLGPLDYPSLGVSNVVAPDPDVDGGGGSTGSDN